MMLVFDFDGTLVDSNRIKWRAFEACFSEFSDRRQKILAYCRGNNHVTRGVKFRVVYEQMLGLPYTPKVAERLHRRFEEETTEAIVRAPEIPGASEFLKRVRPKHRTAVLSATPHPILLEILKRRGWSGHFDLKQGAPVNKAAWLRGLEGKGYPPAQVLFFGDTPEDARAAQEAGCRFIPVSSPALSGGHAVLNDFKEFQLE